MKPLAPATGSKVSVALPTLKGATLQRSGAPFTAVLGRSPRGAPAAAPHAAAYLAPPMLSPPEPAAAAAQGARASMEDLLPALVRKVAWSGDGRRGTVRLELGSGAMAGAEVVIESDEGRVRVHLRAPAGCDVDAWRQRIGARLAARGLDVDELDAVMA